MKELIGYVSQLIAYIEANAANLNSETQRELTTLLQQVMQFVEIYQQRNPVESMGPTPTPQEQLTEGGPSSNVESFGYDDKTGQLLVRFLGKYPDRNGPIYAYGGVPKEIFDLFQKGAIPARTNGKNKWGEWWKGKVPSFGASLYTLIKTQGYPYQKLT